MTKIIGNRIKQRRVELNMTADDLAAKTGKSRATIYRYENGDIENLPTSVLEPLAKALDTTPADLMGWDGPSDESETPYIPQTIAAHFDGDEFTEDELDEIASFIEFVKAKKKGKK